MKFVNEFIEGEKLLDIELLVVNVSKESQMRVVLI